MNLETLLHKQADTPDPPFRIAFIYAVVGVSWILFSDRLLALLVHDAAMFARFSLYKGWAYVALTAWMLYCLIGRYYRKVQESGRLVRENEELLRNVLETLPVGVWLIDRNGRIRYGNRAGQSIWGGAMFVGLDQYDRYKGWWTDTGKLIEADEWGAARAITKGESSLDEVIEIETFDGRRKTILHSAVPLRDAEQRVVGVVIANDEITEQKQMEDALRESERQYRLLFENNPQPMWIYDCETLAFLAVNDAAVDGYGYSRDEFLVMTIRDIHPPDLHPGLLEAVRKIPGKYRKPGIWAQLKKDGSRIEVEITTHDMVFAGKSARLVLALDITERIRAEEALWENEERYRSLYENTPAVMFLIDPDTAQIVEANPAAASFYGYTREELVRMKISDLSVLPEEEVLENLRGAKEGPQHVERRHCLKSGEVRDIEVYRGPLAIGNKTYLFSILHDITDRKEAEASLRDNENKLRAITDAAADAIILVDDAKRVTYWNPAAERLFGYACAEVMGENIEFIIPERYRKAHEWGYASFVATGEGELIGKMFEVSALRRGGAEFPVELTISGIRLKSRWHAAGIIRDISERKTLENQLRHSQKMEAIGTLTGGIAHDFNNILTAITGFTSIVRMGLAKDDPLVSHVDNVLVAADRAADLTRSLLAFSRDQPIEPRALDLNKIIHGENKLLARLLREDIELRVETSEEPLVVMADSGHMGQVLMNLGTNARDAMPNGGLISIGTSSVEMDKAFVTAHGYGELGRYALLTFSDTGTGMEEETKQRVFEPFFTTKEVGKGTGLGLSIVYGIVKQHKGYVNCYSEPGIGTTFRIYLPLDGSAVEASVPPARLDMVGGTETILLAEDDEMVRRLVSGVLGQVGYKVIGAGDGEDAVRKFRENSDAIQLAVLDVIMPKKTGREVYEEICRLRPATRVIFISGYPADVFRREELLEAGLHFISKPVSPNVLLRKIREVLGAESDAALKPSG